jgi:hypothetical protein
MDIKGVIVKDTSCVGCKFLYRQDDGYSNYTVTDSEVRCALDKNPNLPAPFPYDWIQDVDNWPRTGASRCERYGPGPFIELDVDKEVGPADSSTDEEQIAAICAHANIGPHGRSDGI